jgi:hypothetical protein
MRVRRVYEIDNQVADQSALVTAGVEMVVLSPFAACSQVATKCTGACWNLREGKPGQPQPGNRDSFAVTQRLRVEKSFTFRKTETNRWRCDSPALQPVDFGVSLSGR